MQEAQSLFREGVLALQEARDIPRARQLLLQSLKANPQNEMAWLWLAKTTSDPAKQLECLERALKINPQQAQALEWRARLQTPAAQDDPFADIPDRAPSPSGRGEQNDVRATGSSLTARARQQADARLPLTPDPSPTAGKNGQRGEASRIEARRATRDDLALAHTPAFSDDAFADDGSEHLERIEDEIEAKHGASVTMTMATPLSASESKQIDDYMVRADERLREDDKEGAIEQWVRVLEIRADHEKAMRNAVLHLYKLGYADDARTLVHQAIDAGSLAPSVYLTAVDLAKRQGDQIEMNALVEEILAMPRLDSLVIEKIADIHLNNVDHDGAASVMERALAVRPDDQRLLMRMARLQEETFGRKDRAAVYLDRAARTKGGSGKLKKQAEALLGDTAPVITDNERGSVTLAVREAAGIGIAYLLLAWQDAQLNLAYMGAPRWLGVMLAFVGGYLLVTATSSPQQAPIAALLGGRIPTPKEAIVRKAATFDERQALLTAGVLHEKTKLPIVPEFARYAIGAVGTAMLIAAAALVLSTAFGLLRNPNPTDVPSVYELISEPFEE